METSFAVGLEWGWDCSYALFGSVHTVPKQLHQARPDLLLLQMNCLLFVLTLWLLFLQPLDHLCLQVHYLTQPHVPSAADFLEISCVSVGTQ